MIKQFETYKKTKNVLKIY